MLHYLLIASDSTPYLDQGLKGETLKWENDVDDSSTGSNSSSSLNSRASGLFRAAASSGTQNKICIHIHMSPRVGYARYIFASFDHGRGK